MDGRGERSVVGIPEIRQRGEISFSRAAAREHFSRGSPANEARRQLFTKHFHYEFLRFTYRRAICPGWRDLPRIVAEGATARTMMICAGRAR
jgi:hypothetical protein